MTITLAPEMEVKLEQLAREKGVSAGELVATAVDRMIADERAAMKLPRWQLGMGEPVRRSALYDDVG